MEIYGNLELPFTVCVMLRPWYLKVKEEILKRKAVKYKYDDAILFFNSEGILHGILCCHVDDFFWRGTKQFEINIINVLKGNFKISVIILLNILV